MQENTDLNTVIIDIDGVISPHSNRKFYASYIMDIVRCLKSSFKMKPKEILKAVKDFKKNNKKGLFNFIYSLSKDKKEFDAFADSLLKKTKYWHILFTSDVREAFLKTLQNNKIIILTDNLKEHAQQIISKTTGIERHQNLEIYGIEDSLKNGKFNPKNSENGIKIFLEKMNLLPEKCLLLDDKKDNIERAKSCGIKTVRVNSHAGLLAVLNKINHKACDDKTIPDDISKILYFSRYQKRH
jgi:HAD superfamily hydrolase (TIGR01509 family)